MSLNAQYEFGPFRLDPVNRTLLRDGEPVQLAPKAFDILLVLVENQGQIVRKDALIKAVWPDSFVEEINLTVHISSLRKALGDSPSEQHYIKTVARLGYGFVPKVNTADGQSTLLLADGRDDTGSPRVAAHSQPNPDEVKRVRLPILGPRGRPALVSLLFIVIAVALLLLLLLWRARRNPGTDPDSRLRSVAVLPFKPLGDGGKNEVLGLGMADATIVRLSRLSELTVIPTSSIVQYADGDRDVIKLGRELRVDAVVTGTVQRLGDTVRVSVQLIKPRDGNTLWADTFEGRFADVFTLQDSISESVADALRLEVADVRGRLAIRHPANTEAYESYLMGLYFWRNRKSKEGLTKAVRYFTDATEIDPNYAVAFAGLADSYCLLVYLGYDSGTTLYEKAKALAQRSLDLDESLAEANCAMGLIQCGLKDHPSAERFYKRALHLNPSYATAHQRYAAVLVYNGRLNEGIAEMKKARQLDPLSAGINCAVAEVLVYARQYDESLTYCERALEIDPDSRIAHLSAAITYEHKKMYPEAIAEFQKARQIGDIRGESTAFLGHAYVQAGQTSLAWSVLADLRRRAQHESVSHYGMALVLGSLGEKASAVKELESAIANEDFDATVGIRFDPRLDDLRADPRFNELLKNHNLAG